MVTLWSLCGHSVLACFGSVLTPICVILYPIVPPLPFFPLALFPPFPPPLSPPAQDIVSTFDIDEGAIPARQTLHEEDDGGADDDDEDKDDSSSDEDKEVSSSARKRQKKTKGKGKGKGKAKKKS